MLFNNHSEHIKFENKERDGMGRFVTKREYPYRL